MQKLFRETEEKAYHFLREFGFEENELDPVISKGLQELEETLNRLQSQLNQVQPDIDSLDSTLHGIKGLLFQLGNYDAANKVERLRYLEDVREIREWLDSLS